MFDKAILYPPFARKLMVFEAKLYAAKLPFYGFCGMRSFNEQMAEWLKGRNAAGEVIDRMKIVTKARPGYSYHQYGVAADYVEDSMPDKPGMQWSWNLANDVNHDGRKDWQQMAEIAERECGLESAMFWKTFPEGPHIQLAGLPKVEVLLALYQKGGLPAVWAELDKSFNFDNV